MTGEVQSEKRKSRITAPIIVGAVLLFVALFAPFVLAIYTRQRNWSASILTPTWLFVLDEAPWWFLWHFDPLSYYLSLLQFTCLRYLFVYLMVNYYREKTSRKRVILIGVVCELQFFIMYSLFMGGLYGDVIIPLPLLMMVGILLVRFFPPKINQMWVEKEKPSQWWTNPELDNPETSIPIIDETKDQNETEIP